MDATLRTSWRLGPLTVPNRLLLAPLAGIGNWCIRMQARRHGAGHAVSEMVSSHAIHYGNERTLREPLRIHPDQGPVSGQLFGNHPEIMRSAAARAAEAGAAIIDLNMGCPVPKVCKAGSGAALLKDHDLAVRIARAAGEGSGLPVTVKLRPGQLPGERDGIELAKRLAGDAGVVAIALHPRHVSQQHKGRPDYGLARELARELPVPLILSGGLRPTRAEVLAAGGPGSSPPTSRPSPRRSCSRAASSGTRGFSPRSSVIATTRRSPTRSSTSSPGSWIASRSTWAPSVPGAGCARPIPGSSSAWARERRCSTRSSGPTGSRPRGPSSPSGS